MNNEPVAWMVETSDDITFMLNIKGASKPDNSWDKVTPVYTHPAKELTDEALKTFYEDRLEACGKREETLLKTIEALLRKAQEK